MLECISGSIIKQSQEIFHVKMQIEEEVVLIDFFGELTVDNPFQQLAECIMKMESLLKQTTVKNAEIDCSLIDKVNPIGFYVLMDFIRMVYRHLTGFIHIKRKKDDPWQQKFIPILINLEEPDVDERTTISDL